MSNADDFDRGAIIEREWREALADAQLDESEFCLIVVDRPRRETDRLAVWYEPEHTRLNDDILQGEDVDRANSRACIDRHVIATWRDFDANPVGVAILAGRLRHELEHVRQYKALGYEPFDLDRLLDRVLAERIEHAGRSSAAYYNFKPIELDANAAASMYIRRHFPDLIERLLDTEDSALVRSKLPPEGPETLVGRTIAYLYLFRGAVARVADPVDPRDFIPSAHPERTRAAWSALEAADPPAADPSADADETPP